MNKILKILISTIFFSSYSIPLHCHEREGNYLQTTPNDVLNGTYREGLNVQLNVDSTTLKEASIQNN